MSLMGDVDELAGVYNADGGLRGEAAYIVGSLLGRAHCSLCDITHSPFRRKAEWDERAGALGVPFRLLHRNEVDADMGDALAQGYPVVLGRRAGVWQRLVEPEEMEACHGSVGEFFALLQPRLQQVDSREAP